MGGGKGSWTCTHFFCLQIVFWSFPSVFLECSLLFKCPDLFACFVFSFEPKKSTVCEPSLSWLSSLHTNWWLTGTHQQQDQQQEVTYLVFTCMPSKSYRTQFRSLLWCPLLFMRCLLHAINSLCWLILYASLAGRSSSFSAFTVPSTSFLLILFRHR